MPVPPILVIRFFQGFWYTFLIESEVIKMSVNDKTKLEAYEELIVGLERENKIQSRLIEAQSAMIQSLEEHNVELEKIISELSSV